MEAVGGAAGHAAGEVPVIPYVPSAADDQPPKGSAVHHPSALRNRGPIARKLHQVLGAVDPPSPSARYAVEIGSGTGAHLELLRDVFPHLTWQPSEYIPAAVGGGRPFDGNVERTLSQIDAFGSKVARNVQPAVNVDASLPFDKWPGVVVGMERATTLVYASNVTHISPWAVTQGIMASADRLLGPGGRLVIYGPFKKNGVCTTDSNAAFDVSLKARDPRWGYRDIESEIMPEAERRGLELLECHDMPANNFLLVFARRGAAASTAAL